MTTEATYRPDGASFRDPASRVFVRDGQILRGLSDEGLEDWQKLAATTFFAEAQASGRIVATELAGDDVRLDGFAATLRHERIPFVSYPYEWPFGMLKDAALLHLDLLEAALGEDMILKDASPYNVQWRGAVPVFTDIGSFERLRPGQPWIGYRQFCMQFLYPLLLQALRDVSFRPWLRGSVDGIAPDEIARVLSRRDKLRRGVLSHVVLHSRLERRYEDKPRDLDKELEGAGFRKELIEANVRGLRKLVRGLEWSPPTTAWTQYRDANSYTDADAARKLELVGEVIGSRRWPLVWDLGANDGRFARLAAEAGSYVVAVDADPAVSELLYRELAAERNELIHPIVVDLADSSPALGWRGAERKPLAERGRPDLTLCLALVHHLAITRSIPLPEIVAWLADLGGTLVVELPTPEDPMVQRLLAAKRLSATHEYGVEPFEQALTERFTIERRETLPSGTRHLFVARARL